MRTYYPWLIALIAGLTLLVSNGMSITGLPVYDEFLLTEFGWGRGELKFRDMITFLVVGCLAPFAGILIDRWGVRVCMLMGWSLLIAAYVAYSALESLSGLYMIHTVLGLVLLLCGLNVAVILVSHWFVEKRGTAIGIALVGTSLGGAVLPQYGTHMIQSVGWRDALQSEVVFPILMIALTIFLVRNKPQDMGMEPVGGALIKSMTGSQSGMGYAEALRTRTFWALTIIAMATYYTVLGVQAHVFLYMRDLAFTPGAATNAISVFFICALIGKIVFGMLADYLKPKKVFYGNILVMAVGACLLASMQKQFIWVAVTLFGLGWGGVYTMIQLSAMNSFGLKSAGKILGTITVLDALGGGLGIWLTGVMYSVYGDYRIAFTVFAVLILVAFFCISQVKGVDLKKDDLIAPQTGKIGGGLT